MYRISAVENGMVMSVGVYCLQRRNEYNVIVYHDKKETKISSPRFFGTRPISSTRLQVLEVSFIGFDYQNLPILGATQDDSMA